MKKMMLIMAVALMAAACEGPPGIPGPQGPPGTINKAIYNIDIEAQDWIWNEATGSYSFMFDDIEALTPYVIDEGLYYMYFKWYDGNILIQEGMPVITYNEDQFGLWEYSIACDYSDYTVMFYVRNSDFGDQRPDSMSFRLVVFW